MSLYLHPGLGNDWDKAWVKVVTLGIGNDWDKAWVKVKRH
jgi:hypothetical protein